MKATTMPLFTVEVAGTAVIVFAEESRESAQEVLTTLIGPDLQDFESNGVPVWDGEAPLALREADPVESIRWEQGLAEAKEDSADAPDGEDFAVFLIELDDEAEDEDEAEEG